MQQKPHPNPYYLAQLRIRGYRHYAELSADFAAGLNGIVGVNGSGKTSLLDAIHYVLSARSAVVRQEAPLIRHQSTSFGLAAQLQTATEGKQQVLVTYDAQKKTRLIQVNEVRYASRAAYIGRFPVLFVSPEDVLMVGSAEARRRFFDPLIAGMHPPYLSALITYYRQLRQRQALLKSHLQSATTPDEALLDSYDEVLKTQAQAIHTQRSAFMQTFAPYFQRAYAALAPKEESASIRYQSALEEPNWQGRYDEYRQMDIARATTHIGIHRDDYLFAIQQHPVRTHASRGQTKTYVLALQIAYYHQYIQHKHQYPILLMDDITDTLDAERSQRILQLLTRPSKEVPHLTPQIFISAQQMPIFKALVDPIALPSQIFQLNSFRLVPYETQNR